MLIESGHISHPKTCEVQRNYEDPLSPPGSISAAGEAISQNELFQNVEFTDDEEKELKEIS